MSDMKNKFSGSLVGSAVGDAIGELAFHFASKERLGMKLGQMKRLIYTDDTAMTIGLGESLIKKGYLDTQDLGERFKHNFKNEPWRGYASGPPTIFSMVERTGVSYTEAAKSLFGGKGSFGNGAAMRAAPVGLLYFDSPNLYQEAALSASVTHAHPIGVDGAAVQAKAVGLALDLNPEEDLSQDNFMQNLIAFAQTQQMKSKLELLLKLLDDETSPMRAAQHIGRSVSAQESLPFALFCFLHHPKNFADCLFCAVLNGGDRDTLGAMACAVSGAYLGLQSIPPAWRAKLENRSHIEHIAQKLLEMRTSNE
jgi:poly(ADP-ribose) glycohydrolase ARH3